MVLVDIQKPFYSNNDIIRSNFPNFGKKGFQVSVSACIRNSDSEPVGTDLNRSGSLISVHCEKLENPTKNVADMLKFGRENKMKIVHVRAVYNENVSPWIKNFRVMNPKMWNCIIDNDCTEDFAEHKNDEIGRF